MSEEEQLAAFCTRMMPAFYRHVMDGGEPPVRAGGQVRFSCARSRDALKGDGT
jgi:hypothetical protein